jgi:hypothetical protein
MFRDDRQLALVCRALCTRAGVPDAWTVDGPGALAFDVREGRGPLSSGQSVLVLVAWAFWNGEGGLTLARVLDVLDGEHVRALAALLVARSDGGDAVDVDAWLREHGPRLRQVQ